MILLICMKSRGFKYKDEVIALRKMGVSMTMIEREFNIPRSTLSGWFKDVALTEDQRTRLMKNSQDGWKKAREHAVISKNIAKAKRISQAKAEAELIHSSLPKTNEVLELALAMLYFGEGAKKNVTTLGASDSKMITFFITALERLYDLDRNTFRYELHLRFDQDEDEMKNYWSQKLHVQRDRFQYTVKDLRTKDRPTKPGYHGVCQVHVGNIAIQRRLKALYSVYCSEVIAGT